MGGKTMRYAVIGGGSGGKAVSAYLREMGHEVAIYCRDGGHAAALSRDGITATGAVEGRFPVTATDRLAQAVRGRGPSWCRPWPPATPPWPRPCGACWSRVRSS